MEARASTPAPFSLSAAAPKSHKKSDRRKDWHSLTADAFLDLPMKKHCQARSRFADAPPSNRRPPRARNRKRQGELAELAFMSKAASLGFGVAKPYGDSERFDFILSWNRHLWRVQVKSTRTAKRGVYEISAHGCWGDATFTPRTKSISSSPTSSPRTPGTRSPSKPRGAASVCASIPTSPSAPATNTKSTAKPGGY